MTWKKHIFSKSQEMNNWEVVFYTCCVWLFPTQMFVNGKCHFEEKKSRNKNKKKDFVAGKHLDPQKYSKESCIQERFFRFCFFMPLQAAGSSTYTWSVEVICPTCGLSHHIGSQGLFKCIQPWTASTALCFSSTSLKTCQNEHFFFSSGMFHLPPSHQPLLPSDVWFSLCCALAIQTRLNRVQPSAFSSLCFHST